MKKYVSGVSLAEEERHDIFGVIFTPLSFVLRI